MPKWFHTYSFLEPTLDLPVEWASMPTLNDGRYNCLGQPIIGYTLMQGLDGGHIPCYGDGRLRRISSSSIGCRCLHDPRLHCRRQPTHCYLELCHRGSNYRDSNKSERRHRNHPALSLFDSIHLSTMQPRTSLSAHPT